MSCKGTYRLLTVISLCLLSTGCSWTDKRGTHHLIVGIGLGIITTTNRVGVDVRDSHIIGAEFGTGRVGVGWMQRHRVAIDPAVASNVVVSVKARPFSMTVRNFDPFSIDFTQHNQTAEAKKAP